MNKILATAIVSSISFAAFANNNPPPPPNTIDNRASDEVVVSGHVSTPISIEVTQDMEFPDVVIPNPNSAANTVIMTTGGAITFTGDSSPHQPTTSGSGDDVGSPKFGVAKVDGEVGYTYSLVSGDATCNNAAGNLDGVTFTPTLSGLDNAGNTTIKNNGTDHSIGGTISVTDDATSSDYTCTFSLTATYVGNL